MGLTGRLREKSSAIVERWLRDALATYPKDASAAFGRQKDPFANPVGHALRAGTRAAWEALLEGKEPEEICSSLHDVVKIRAVQEFSPSQAISFVFLLKEAVRAELRGDDGQGPPASGELAELERQLDRQIDQIALGVFDTYMRCRAQVYELRVNEVKRSVARLVERMNRGSPFPESDEELLQPAASPHAAAERGDGR